MKSARVRTIVADDEPAARDAIRSLLANDPEIDLIAECADGRSTLAAVRDEMPDLLFLDIQMPELDGFGVLRQLDPENMPVVVFVTAYDSYALRAFEVHAQDYVLKPFDDERFHDAVSHAKGLVRQGRISSLRSQLLELLEEDAPEPRAAPRGRYLERLAIPSDGRVTVLSIQEVDWIQAEGDYIRINAKRTQYLLRETMKTIESQVDPARFVRIHRSTIVNVERIKELQPYFRGEYVVLLQDGARLKLSRGYRKQLEGVLGRSI